MKSLTAFLFLFLTSFLLAQTPPTSTYTTVGVRNQAQPYSSLGGCVKAGEQWIQARTASGDASTNVFIGNAGPRVGRLLWWVTSAVAVVPAAPATPSWHQAGATPATVIGIASLNGIVSYPFPGAAPGFHLAFMPAGFVLLSPSAITVNTVSAQCATIPAGGYDQHWIYWAIPNDPALAGQVVTMQAARIEPLNGLWYLSDEWITQIAP